MWSKKPTIWPSYPNKVKGSYLTIIVIHICTTILYIHTNFYNSNLKPGAAHRVVYC